MLNLFFNDNFPNKNVSFGYKHSLKRHWLRGEMPGVKFGIYGGRLTKDNVTLEHIIPRNKRGKTVLGNLALAVDINNWCRGSAPFAKYYNPDIFERYCNQFKDIFFPDFDGNEYIRQLRNTVNRLLGKKKESKSGYVRQRNQRYI